MNQTKTTYAKAEEEFERSGFIRPDKFTKDQLDEIFDAAPAGSPIEAAVLEALSWHEH